MQQHVVLIDFENVQPANVNSLDDEHIRVLVFVGQNQSRIPLTTAASLQMLGDRARYVRISGNGSNALDFHIAFYIGMLATSEPKLHFHIVSKDTGFDPLISHLLKDRDIWIERVKSLGELKKLKTPKHAHTATIEVDPGRIAAATDRLRNPKQSKPRTVKTLSNAILSLFQKQVSDDEIEAIVQALRQTSVIEVSDSGKVSYPEVTSD